jgi:CheY-like chemotaxis protein
MNLSVERDITQAKAQATRLEAALTEAQSAAESKSNFLATMSHEIRTPMNGIIGMADLLTTTKLNKTQKEYVNIISQSGDGLLQIINDILDFSKLDAGNMDIEMHPFDPRETLVNVQNLMCPLATEKGLDLLLIYETDLPEMLKGDAGRIRQILLNLLGNSIKFTAQGKIKIAISHVQNGTQIELVIKVTDTGIGIPKDRLGSIFEQFSQAEEDTSRRFGGTGLGLSISRLLAQNMGGDISVTSEVGKGSIFEVLLMVEAAEQIKPVVESPSKELSLNFLAGKTILIAEDNKTNRFLIRKMLTDTKAEIMFAEDGVQAVEKFQTIAPDLVLMDISMPHKDGKQATIEIRDFEQRELKQPVPIIALTANAFKEDRDDCFKAGMDGFLTKPIRRAVLHAEINRIWKMSSQSPEKIDV